LLIAALAIFLAADFDLDVELDELFLGCLAMVFSLRGEKTLSRSIGSLTVTAAARQFLSGPNVKGTAALQAAMPFDMVSGRR
jgi:hypothetical protein